jgi:hypothetical protein
MRKNALLFIILIILLLAAIYFFFSRGPGAFKNPGRQFSVADTSLVRKVEITAQNGSVTLQRHDGQWVVNDIYSARNRLVQGLLTTLHRLQPDVPVSRKMQDEVLLRLKDHSTRIAVTLEGKRAKTYYAWYDSLDGGATYMILEGYDQPYRMHLPGMEIKGINLLYLAGENYWRDNSLFSLKPGQISAIEVRYFNRPDASFRIEKGEGGEWLLFALSGDQSITDFSRENILNYLYYFSNVRFDKILTAEESKGLTDITGQPATEISVKMENGTGMFIRCFPRYIDEVDGDKVMDMDRLYLQVNNTEELLLARYIQVDLILKDLSYFLPE